MKNNIENFIVGIWPTWNADDITEKFKNEYPGITLNNSESTGGIITARNLIKLSKEYSNRTNTKLTFYLLPNQNAFKHFSTPKYI